MMNEGLSTRCVHAGEIADAHGSPHTPIYNTTTFKFPTTADLLDRARKPLLESMTKARRENSYWLPYVAEATSRADRLDRSRNSLAIVGAATPAELQALAQRYLLDDKALVIKAVSDKAGK